MFKKSSSNNKSFTQQRAILKPIKNVAFFQEEQNPNGILEQVGEEEEEEEEDDDCDFMDDGSSCYSNHKGLSSRNDTMLLAQFLSTTGPEECVKEDTTKKQQQFKKASRLLSRLRKRPTMPALRSSHPQHTSSNHHPAAPTEKKNYIPLPVHDSLNNLNSNHNYNHQQQQYNNAITSNHGSKSPSTTTSNKKALKCSTSTSVSSCSITPSSKRHPPQQQHATSAALRDSGVYSETASEKDSSMASNHGSNTTTAYASVAPPVPPFTSVLSELHFPHPPYPFKQSSSNPRRPAPLPPAVASAAIATACSPNIHNVPEAALKRRSVRLRHVQVQTTRQEEKTTSSPTFISDQQACPHCRQYIGNNTKDANRLRRPSCPPALSSGPMLSKDKEDAKFLLAMIMKLKSQLEEEKQCRLQLEKAMRQDQHRSMLLAKEKVRWAGDCLWLDDRIALLPE